VPGTERFLQPVIAADHVRYVGEPIAVVFADSAALAEDGVACCAGRCSVGWPATRTTPEQPSSARPAQDKLRALVI